MGTEEKRVPLVLQELERLGKACSEQEDVLNVLANKLSDVMTTQQMPMSSDLAPQEEPLNVPLANLVRELGTRVMVCTDRIRSMIERLAV